MITELQKRLGVTSEFIDKDNHKYWMTDRCQLIDPDIAGSPMPELLANLIHKSISPSEMIYLIQIGLGVYDEHGNRLPMRVGLPTDVPRPKTYKLFRDALTWLESNYLGGWFYAVDKIWKEAKTEY